MLRVRPPPLPLPESPEGSPISSRRLSGSPRSSFALIRKIGSGSRGEVWLGEMDGHDVAIKIMENDDHAQHELSVLLSLPRHPNIVDLLAYQIQPDRVYLVLEYVPGTNLQDWVWQEESELKSTLLQIAEGVRHLHANNVVHRDLKPENMVRQDDGRVVILDFDLACRLGSDDSTTFCPIDTRGTPYFIAPEVWTQTVKSDEQLLAVDMFAVGATLYTIIEGTVPFETPEERPTIEDLGEVIVNDQPRPMVYSRWEWIVLPLLSKQPSKRSNSTQLVDTLRRVASNEQLP